MVLGSRTSRCRAGPRHPLPRTPSPCESGTDRPTYHGKDHQLAVCSQQHRSLAATLIWPGATSVEDWRLILPPCWIAATSPNASQANGRRRRYPRPASRPAEEAEDKSRQKSCILESWTARWAWSDGGMLELAMSHAGHGLSHLTHLVARDSSPQPDRAEMTHLGTM